MKCPNCEVSSGHKYDLNELAASKKGANPEAGSEPFRVTLPYLSKVAGKEIYAKVRFMRGRESMQLAKESKIKHRNQVHSKSGPKEIIIDQTISDNLSMLITAVGEEGGTEDSSSFKINKLVNRMHASDTSAVREFLRNNSPGIDTTIEVKCPDCATNYSTELPITESFFRPSNS